jgi:hypothetical protein
MRFCEKMDVKITRHLLLFARDKGYLIYQQKGATECAYRLESHSPESNVSHGLTSISDRRAFLN